MPTREQSRINGNSRPYFCWESHEPTPGGARCWQTAELEDLKSGLYTSRTSALERRLHASERDIETLRTQIVDLKREGRLTRPQMVDAREESTGGADHFSDEGDGNEER
jgi:hypothetical protein